MKILDLLNEDETVEDEVFANEIEEAGNLTVEIKTDIRVIDEALETKTNPPEDGSASRATGNISPPESENHEGNDDESNDSVTSVRLPKINTRKFDEKIEQ